jgi:hypothetical protein
LCFYVIAEELGKEAFASANVGYADPRLYQRQDELKDFVVGAAMRDWAYLAFRHRFSHSLF